MASYKSENDESMDHLNRLEASASLAEDTEGSAMQERHGCSFHCGCPHHPELGAQTTENSMHIWNGNPASKPNVKMQQCSLCESVVEVEYHCHLCQHDYCKRCQHCHDKLCGHPARQNMVLEDLQRRFNEVCQIIPSLQASNASLTQHVMNLTSNQEKQSSENQSLALDSNAQKLEIPTFQQALMGLREENAGLNQSLEKLRKENFSLNQAVLSLTEEHTAMDQTVGKLKKENFYLSCAHDKLHQEVSQIVAAHQAGYSSQKPAAVTNYDDSQVQADILQLQSHKMKVDSELQSLRSECNKVINASSKVVNDYVPQVARLQAVVFRLEEEVREMRKSDSATGFSASAAAPKAYLPTSDSPESSTCGTTYNTTSFQFLGKNGTTGERRPSTLYDEEEKEEEDVCPVCLAPITSPKVLKCGHKFCTACIERAMAVTPRCPKCQHRFGIEKGTQPQNGTMMHVISHRSLPGYIECGSIVISYKFPSGNQEEGHPNPGRFYNGTERTAYLPDNKEGREVLSMLYKAFSNRLTFTIGTSATTGISGVITWNDIHHKTNMRGGPCNFGYPDPGYLARVKLELADKGIFPS